MSNPTSYDSYTVRLAHSTDASQLAHLAALDSNRIPDGDLIVAEAQGRIFAARPLAGGWAIADPFVRTAAVTEVLELRARQLNEERRVREPGFLTRLMSLFERPAVRVN